MCRSVTRSASSPAMNGHAPWFEIDSSGDASRLSVAISFVDDAGRGG